MKCPQCTHDQTAKQGLICNKCGYQYVFDPRKDSFAGKVADGKFLARLRKATAGDTRWITREEFCSQALLQDHFTKGIRVFLAWVWIVLAILTIIFILSLNDGSLAALIGLIVATILNLSHRNPPRKNWNRIIDKWLAARRPINKLIKAPSLHNPPPGYQEDDIYDYGVERLIICERDILVDWFIFNGLHSSESALIVAESGYPHYLTDRANRILADNPDLPVFLLHDSTPAGVAMESRLAESSTFLLEGHKVIDLGIAPADVTKLRLYPMMKEKNRLPLDALPYGTLSVILGVSFTEEISLAAAYVHGNTYGSESDFG